jgi:hypothetical protein
LGRKDLPFLEKAFVTSQAMITQKGKNDWGEYFIEIIDTIHSINEAMFEKYPKLLKELHILSTKLLDFNIQLEKEVNSYCYYNKELSSITLVKKMCINISNAYFKHIYDYSRGNYRVENVFTSILNSLRENNVFYFDTNIETAKKISVK